jgi:hypothetical protein
VLLGCPGCLLQADQAREADATITSLQQRCERLAAELQEAAVQVEVLSAKGRLYDELQAKADKLVGWGADRLGGWGWGRVMYADQLCGQVEMWSFRIRLMRKHTCT